MRLKSIECLVPGEYSEILKVTDSAGRVSYDFAVVLDANSLMTADSVLRLVRIMQANPRLGILQSLVTGMPSTSAFARIFQFGMRLGMRSATNNMAPRPQDSSRSTSARSNTFQVPPWEN